MKARSDKTMSRAKAQRAPRFLKSPSFPLCQRGMKGGFRAFFAGLASWRETISWTGCVKHFESQNLCAELSQRFRHFERTSRALDDGSMDQWAAEGDGAVAAGVRLSKGLQDFLTVVDFRGGRAEDGVDGIDLRRVNQGHSGKSQLARLFGESQETFAVVQVDPNTIDRLHVGRSRGDDESRAGVNQIASFPFDPPGH